jgi:hypothetical protein
MISKTYEEWKKCIESDCKIELTRAFAEKRLAIYRDIESEETKKFINLYGHAHYVNIINWFSNYINTQDQNAN